MKKKSLDSSNEIDLIELIEIFWNEKIKIVTIIIVTCLIFFSYNQLQPKPEPNQYQISLTINESDNSEYIKLLPVLDYLNSELSKTLDISGSAYQYLNENISFNINSKSLIYNFLKKLSNFKQLVSVLEKNKTVLEKLTKYSEEEKLSELYNYARLLKIEKPNSPFLTNSYLVSFTWEDPDEGREILIHTINLVISELQKSIYNEIDQRLDQIKKKKLFEDLRKIEFLSEQSVIAEELSIKDSYVDIDNNLSFNINVFDNSYYLKGKKVIDKEIEIIKNRNYTEVKTIRKKINELKKSKINWIDFNPNLLDVEILQSSSANVIKLHSSILIGLFIGLIYTYISSRLRLAKKVVKDK